MGIKIRSFNYIFAKKRLMCYYICVTDNIIQYKGDQAIGNEDSRYGNRGNNKDRVLINEKIRSKEVRLIDDKGENHGVVLTSKALAMAEEANLDLVVVSPNQAPPVAKILDYGK